MSTARESANAIKSIGDANLPEIVTIMSDFVHAGDVDGILAFRLRFVEELINEASEMDRPDIRVRRIKGAQWQLGAKMHHLEGKEAAKFVMDNFWSGVEFTNINWKG